MICEHKHNILKTTSENMFSLSSANTSKKIQMKYGIKFRYIQHCWFSLSRIILYTTLAKEETCLSWIYKKCVDWIMVVGLHQYDHTFEQDIKKSLLDNMSYVSTAYVYYPNTINMFWERILYLWNTYEDISININVRLCSPYKLQNMIQVISKFIYTLSRWNINCIIQTTHGL